MNTGISLPLLIVLIVVLNLLSRVYGFWVITGKQGPSRKGLLFWTSILFLSLPPLSLPASHPIIKYFILNYTALHIFKLIDYYNRYAHLQEENKGFRRFFYSFDCLYTTNIIKSFLKDPSPPPRGLILKNLTSGLLYAGFGIALLLLNRNFAWWKVSPLIDYLSLGLEYYFLAMGAAVLVINLHRLAGYKVPEFFLNPLRSSSPGEFWTRWNIPVHEWLRNNVFIKAGGRDHFWRAVLLTFMVSGIFHEYTISLASNTLNGFMTAYFLVQFLAFLVGVSLHRLLSIPFLRHHSLVTSKAFLGIRWALTMVSVFLPSVLFLYNLRKVFPIHGV
jgi:hypothetical protein